MKTVSKSIEKVQNSVATLKAKKDKSAFDFVKLANAAQKLEDKTLSNVYKVCSSSQYAKDICGESSVPNFKAFKDAITKKYPTRSMFSYWDGYLVLRSFNVKEMTAKKVKTQNKAVSAI